MERKNVTLLDGRVVDSYSEEWRIECEARAVTKMQSLDKRRSYLEHVEARRGKDAAEELKRLIRLMWRR